MAADKVRLGVIGVGGMGSGHCQGSQSVEEVKLSAVADVDAARAKEIGEKYGVPYFTDHKELLKKKLVDAVIVATPHYYHPIIAIDAFRAGLHVLSEKPIAVQVSQAEKMIKAAEKAKKVFGVMFQRRTEPAVKVARQIVESGELGEIRRTLLVSPEFRSQAYYDSGGWRATWGGEGGGPLMNQSPHIMDLFVLLGGMPSKVRAWTKTLMHNIEVEDQAEAVLEYPNGAVGYFYVSTCEPGPGQIMQIWGEKGKLQFIDGKLSLCRYKEGVSEFSRTNTAMWGGPAREDVTLELPQCETGHGVVLKNFARAILYGEELVSPGAFGIKSLELTNAIMLSSHKGTAVDLPISRRAFDQMLNKLRATSKFDASRANVSKRETDPRLKA